MTFPVASILEAFLQHAMLTPARLCLQFEGAELTYADLRRQVESFAAALATHGLERSDRVALFMENSPAFLAAYLGTHLAGGTVVLVNTQYREVELRHILHDAGVRFCFTEPALRPEIARVQAELPDLATIVERGAMLDAFLAEGQSVPGLLPTGDEIAAIGYTSGTTGRSKGAMLSHRNQVANIHAVCEAWQWTADDYLLLTLPLFHVHGLMVGAHGTLVMGASADLRRGFNAADVLATLMNRTTDRPVTLFFGVPTMYGRLLTEAKQHNHQPPPLRLFVSGSAPLSPQLFTEFERVFGQRILERYGMTETLMNTTNPYIGERRPGTVGQPFPGQAVRVVDVRTRAVLPADSHGEIEVSGPHVFKGYWQRPAATAESFSPDGWFRTGDLGRVSSDGYLTITSRAKELIISGGYNVYPREIEDLLAGCPGVAEVAVLGMPDVDFGERVVAAIVPSDQALTAEQVIAFCRERIASYKKPRTVVFVATLPRNALGKVQKQILRGQLGTAAEQ